jgi:hypothetical protein
MKSLKALLIAALAVGIFMAAPAAEAHPRFGGGGRAMGRSHVGYVGPRVMAPRGYGGGYGYGPGVSVGPRYGRGVGGREWGGRGWGGRGVERGVERGGGRGGGGRGGRR